MTAQRGTVIGVTAFFAGLALLFGAFGYPPAGMNDGAWFMAPGIERARSGDLQNPIRWLDSKLIGGNGPFLSYPPLFPIVVSWFVSPDAATPAPLQAMKGMALITAAALALSAWSLMRIASSDGTRLDWLTALLICVGIALVFRASWTFGTRPEILARLFVTLGLVAAVAFREPRRLALALGALIGFTVATHVVIPVAFAALGAMFFGIRYDMRTSATYLAIIAATAAVAFVAVMQLSPFPIGEMINGTLRHGSAMVSRLTPAGIAAALFSRPPLVVFAGIFAFFAVRLFVRKMRAGAIGSPALVVLSALVFAAYGAFAAANARFYYLTPFVVVAFAALLHPASGIRRDKRVMYPLVVFVGMLAALSLVPAALFPLFLRDGVTLPAARAAFADVLAKHTGAPFMPGGSRMWMLSESYDRMFVAEIPANPGASQYLLITEEWESPDLSVHYSGCALEREFYVSRPPKLFGVQLAHAVPGYGFAVYDCRAPGVK